MSDDTQPVIHTVGSVDKHDQTNLGDDITQPVENIQPRVLDNKLEDTEKRKEVNLGDSVAGSGTQDKVASPHASREPGVVGEIRTVGSVDPVDRGDVAVSKTERRDQ